MEQEDNKKEVKKEINARSDEIYNDEQIQKKIKKDD